MFIGYSTTQKGYKCYVPDTRRVLISRDVKFVEARCFYDDRNWETLKDLSTSPSDRTTNLRRILESLGMPPPVTSSLRPVETEGGTPPVVEPEDTTPVLESVPLDPEGGTEANYPEGNLDDHDQGESVQIDEEPEQDQGESVQIDEEPDQEALLPLRRSTRQKFSPSHWRNTRVYYNSNAVAHPGQAVCTLAHVPQEHQVFIGIVDQEYVPKNYEEAKEHKVWREAVGDERHAMEINHTWDEADLPKGKKAVSSRWIFTIKYKSNGEIERYKVRLVARGFTQDIWRRL